MDGGLVPEPLSPVTPNFRRCSTPIAPRTPSATSSASHSSPSPPVDSVGGMEGTDMDACATPGLPPTIPPGDDEDGADVDVDADAESSRCESAGTPSVQFSLTSSMTSRSSAASYAMMGLGTRQGEEQLKEALRSAERGWTLRTAEQLERLVSDGTGTIILQPASQLQRVLSFKAAHWYGLTVTAAETGGGLVVSVTLNGEGQSASSAQGKNPKTLQLAKLVPRPSSPPPVKVTLMKRATKHSTHTDRHSSAASDSSSATGAPTLAEREASYQLARERIFKAGAGDDARSRASDTASDTQSVRSGRSSGKRSNNGRQGEGYQQETLRRRRDNAVDEEDEFNRTDPRLRGLALPPPQGVPRLSGPYDPRMQSSYDPSLMGFAPQMAPGGMVYDQPVYNSVHSATSLDPLAYGDTSHLAYSDTSYYYPMGHALMPVGYPVQVSGQGVHHPEPPFTSCTPTPGHQPLHYLPPAATYMSAPAPAGGMRHGLMGMPTAQVPTDARLESYLQTSTGPYPPPSNRSAGSPVPSNLDFDGQSTFSESAASVPESSKLPSRTPSRQESSRERRASLGAKSEDRDPPHSPTSVHSAPRPTPRFALPAKPTWVTSPSARSVDGSRPLSNPSYWADPRRGLPDSISMPLARPSPSVSTRSAPASMLGMPTLHQNGRPDLTMRRGESSAGEFGLESDFVRRGNTVRQGKLYDPSSGKVTTFPVGGKKRAGTITSRAVSDGPQGPSDSAVNDDIEAKLQALAIAHNVSIGPPPARRR